MFFFFSNLTKPVGSKLVKVPTRAYTLSYHLINITIVVFSGNKAVSNLNEKSRFLFVS